MKILLVHKFFKYNGGADVFFFEVGRVLEENGHEVAYFSTKDDDNLPSKWGEYFCNAPNFNTNGIVGKLNALTKIPYNIETKKKFEKLIDDFQPDLIHCFNIMTQISPSILVVAKKRNIPVVISLNDYKHICPNYKLFHHGHICEDCKGGKYYNCAKNRCSHDSLAFSVASTIESYIHSWLNVYLKNITLFLFASDFMAKKTMEFWQKTIPYGKLLNPFKIPEISKYKKGENGLYFGRLIDEKGGDLLLKALIIARDIPFKIIGDGPEMDNLKKIVSDNELTNVEFTGPKWNEELQPYLENCKFVVVPSIWHENFPYVIMQAFAAGKAVIASCRGGMPEMVTEERGLLYDANDAKELAAKMEELFRNDEECEKMGRNGRQYIEDTFNDKVFYKSIVDNYEKALNLIK